MVIIGHGFYLEQSKPNLYFTTKNTFDTFYMKCSVASNDLVIFNYFTIKTFYKP